MGMHNSTSGKHQYQYHYQEGELDISRDDMEQIVMTEDKMRVSAEWQRMFCKHDNNEWRLQVVHDLQTKALLQHGIPQEDIERGLIALRNHRGKYRDDDEPFYQPVYVKYDRSIHRHWDKAADGVEQTGEPAGDEGVCTEVYDPMMYQLDGTQITFSSMLKSFSGGLTPTGGSLFEGTKPVVILAGSLT